MITDRLSLSARKARAFAFDNLVDTLRWRAAHEPDGIAYTFLEDGEGVEQNVTYAELDRRALRIARRLTELGPRGSRALIVYDASIEYICALLGCFYASMIAVPVYPPDPMRVTRTLARLESIVRDSQAHFLLTSASKENWAVAIARTCDSLQQVLLTDQIDSSPDANSSTKSSPSQHLILPPPNTISGDDVALLQYTSGSTGTPKGCIVSHGNLMYNFRHIQQFDQTDAVVVSWLPMYHDMGLMGKVLQTLYSGRRLVLMSPLSFVQRPFRWLRAISKYRAYATSGPNFAYELCTRKISDDELSELDLSCWTLACNGAEPVRAETLNRFAKRFAACGFNKDAFYPCYGLAEATLIVSGGQKQQPPIVMQFDSELLAKGTARPVLEADAPSRELVGCGSEIEDCEIRIVDPQTLEECDEGQVGEIWVHSPGVAKGYWGRPAESFDVFQAKILHESESFEYLRTGDLGFLADGELFVNGRLKELIIVNGRNHYPQDIEQVVQDCHRSLRRDAGAAFAVQIDGEERLVVVQEVVRPQRIDLEELLAAIRGALARDLELEVHAILLVKGGSVPKTSSGKLQRRACRQLFLDSEWKAIAEFQRDHNPDPKRDEGDPSSARMEPVAVNRKDSSKTSSPRSGSQDFVGDVVGILRELKPGYRSEISEDTRLFSDLGLASIDAMDFHSRVEKHYDQRFPLEELMAEIGRRDSRDVTVGQFVEFLCNHFVERDDVRTG